MSRRRGRRDKRAVVATDEAGLDPLPPDGGGGAPDAANKSLQYAIVEGLLDPALPCVTFVVELPFQDAQFLATLPRVVVPMNPLRTGEDELRTVKVEFAVTTRTGRSATTPLDHLRSLPDRAGEGFALLRGVPTPAPTDEQVVVVELTTENLLDPPGASTGERGVRLLGRCIEALDRVLSAYLVASEDFTVRPVAQEALGLLSAVEFRDNNGLPLQFGGMVTMPRATTPQGRASDAEALLVRMDVAMQHESVRHPMDVVVLWQLRAEHYSQVAGDYEMALLALNVSAEVLVDAIWDAHRVDEGEGSGALEQRPQFMGVLKRVSTELGQPWDQSVTAGPFADYVERCYRPRNVVTHEGRRASSDDLDDAFEAYEGLHELWRR